MSKVQLRQAGMKQVVWRKVGWRQSDNTLDYPSGAILHFDADLDPYTEQTGGPHTFNHAVLSPQYQRNADGSYSNVGAKPAVDTFDGEKWLRSCGAVTNLLPSGSEDLTASSWIKRGTAVVAAGNLVSGIATGANNVYILKDGLTAGESFTPSIEIKRVATTGVLSIQNPSDGNASGRWDVDLSLLSYDYEKITSDHPSVSVVNAFVASSSGVSGIHFRYQSGALPLSFYARNPQLTATSYPVPYTPPGTTMPASNATTTNGSWFTLPDGSELWHALDGEIQPQNLITNGNFDTNIDGWNVYKPTATILSWQNGKLRIQNNGNTYGAANQAFSTVVGGLYEVSVDITVFGGVPARARVDKFPDYLASGAINTTTSGTYKFRFTATATTTYLLLGNRSDTDAYNEFDNISIQRIQPQPLTLATRVRMGVGSGDVVSAGGIVNCIADSSMDAQYMNAVSIVKSNCGQNAVEIAGSFSRNAIIQRFTQVNSAGTQFRVGYMIDGTHTTIQWSSWTAFDGSFGPSTLYRLMLGFHNPYPQWFNKITVWKKQATDAEILEAMS